jgi:stringent starvation protein B
MAMLRSYLVDSTHEWIVDHGFTPYVLVDTEYESVEVPWDYVEDDGKIVLNMAPDAIIDYQCTDEFLSFHASFDGEAMQIFLPMESIMGMYAKETGQGLYARESGFGLMINEGENDEDVNPKSMNTSASESNGDDKGGLRLI